jgi:hypothetical protein
MNVTKYEGVTERGRRVSEDSLQAAVESLAFVANRDPRDCMTRQGTNGTWYVYDSQEALDSDAAQASEHDREKWFAFVEASS